MRFYFAILCGLSLLACGATISSAANINDFIDFSSPSLPGRLYVPPEAATGPRPLIVFLHGSGEVGSDNQVQVTGQNINNLLLAAKTRGAYLYAPQTSTGWSSTTVMDRVMGMIDQAIVNENVDNRRLYATGLSLGGGGTWNLINRHSDRFAAAVPICAVGPTWGYSPANLAQVPTWAFHARNDMTVPSTETRNVVASMLATTGEAPPVYPEAPRTDFLFQSTTLDLRYTEYRAGGHVIWGKVFITAAMQEWMFSHALVPEPSAGVLMLLTGLGLVGAGRLSRARRRSA